MTENGRGEPPQVSVIVNCYNEGAVLNETLDSVFCQTFQDWEIVFWDNASTDGSGQIAASYGDKVHCFRSDPMVPLGRARKLAYEQTRGKFIAILDADDIWLPEKLERQLELFHSNPELGMTFSDVIYFDEGGDRQRMFGLNEPHRGRVFGKLLIRNFLFSSAMMFRREAVDQLDCAFDDRFSRAQDFDLGLRMAYHFPVDYVEEPLAKWRISSLATKPWKKSLMPRAFELKSAVEDLVETYPEIKQSHGGELAAFHKKIDYDFAVNFWELGDMGKARSHLSRHLTDKKFAFVYLCSLFFSHKSFYRLRIAYRNLTTGLR